MAETDYAELFAADRGLLWGMCYRMTGSAADAEDLVQDTFVRAIERPPARTDEPWRPWLVRVAMNLARDSLRRRRRRGYHGPWLPSPVETGDGNPLPAVEIACGDEQTTEGRYELMESVSYAFLVALEALTPQQRAVLLLRDVFDYSVAETADALDLSAANVKTSLHRARAAMRVYDEQRSLPTGALAERTRAALESLFAALAAQDFATCRALLADDVIAFSDGGDEFLAAKVPLIGPDRVLKFHGGLMNKLGHTIRKLELRQVNGLPAMLVEFAPHGERYAPRVVVRCDLDAEGRIARTYSILATRKLTAVR